MAICRSNWNRGQNIAYAPNDLMHIEPSSSFYSRTNKERVLEIYSNRAIGGLSVQRDFLSSDCLFVTGNFLL